MFAVFAFLQVNDLAQYGNHDAWVWVFLYGVTGLLSVAAMNQRTPATVIIGWCCFSSGALLFRLQDEFGNLHFERVNPTNIWNASGTEMIQNTNECFGLLIIVIWSAFLYCCRRA